MLVDLASLESKWVAPNKKVGEVLSALNELGLRLDISKKGRLFCVLLQTDIVNYRILLEEKAMVPCVSMHRQLSMAVVNLLRELNDRIHRSEIA